MADSRCRAQKTGSAKLEGRIGKLTKIDGCYDFFRWARARRGDWSTPAPTQTCGTCRLVVTVNTGQTNRRSPATGGGIYSIRVCDMICDNLWVAPGLPASLRTVWTSLTPPGLFSWILSSLILPRLRILLRPRRRARLRLWARLRGREPCPHRCIQPGLKARKLRVQHDPPRVGWALPGCRGELPPLVRRGAVAPTMRTRTGNAPVVHVVRRRPILRVFRLREPAVVVLRSTTTPVLGALMDTVSAARSQLIKTHIQEAEEDASHLGKRIFYAPNERI